MGSVVAAFRVHHTHLGTMFVAASGGGIAALAIDGDVATFTAELSERLKGPVLLDQQGIPEAWQRFLDQAIVQIDEYVAGTRTVFTLPLDWRGLSSFERRVLEALSQVPAGTTLTYGELAERIGEPGAARAVGGALGHNPLALLLPCHRIVAADGTLGGYGGGWRTATSPNLLNVKRALLAHEGAWPPSLPPTGRADD
jgi:methylated-DNA-[protein]-cysteine S-methyltransferase